ncbi:MAG: signal peptidase I [Candidatus Ryanbacteria bacterium RIFCSPHIGHO2_02_FULL_45_43]|uniref:Signal peptidase I n=1 Tax=Candidatus Ryanbacteria bacterium RIFCSPHIGHO2_01_45_13 TaxID=1802112 RepID=A0A1G2FZV2_9BACT|nr:MAG: signal peptidase I [Candidatus Ryanbacteria bacterium RIFCSPHIGHO2_01_FULL_44_130]OGZ43120.1 MAG: signal peptidase I [Candidatus Ryanbacteria bacterium RIFCSPHIGHO2_01_45_13]OGZ47805.1 MAG: signal peptidase I [Candidatus Ryanbacteria bacterium RIFCSPHIGHO2_02_FULL_45_43]OGZ49698.1 MAG: signal peptidase I [Candidatus Ryanbacteria bacterium RIFCSPHIGHO2_12_FULL_44_20]OGZ52191.1 MAG: signal peptidase I [Candidatus Ryanbacteria bacterium RIFCSPLOWO2_01_FULL_44_230]OGZ53638.1 MAG: signal pe
MEEKEAAGTEKEEKANSWLRELWGFVKIIIVSLVIVLPIRAYIVQPFIVRGDSMKPTYYQGEYLVIDEFSYHIRGPRRGEIVVFRYPQNPSQYFIKRIVGLPRERVEVRNGEVYIVNEEYPDGIVLDEPYLQEGVFSSPDTILMLDEKEYFVMGDNRYQSSDSRFWGALDSRFIVGRAWLRLWPIARASVL